MKLLLIILAKDILALIELSNSGFFLSVSSRMRWQDLRVEILVKIFSYLDRRSSILNCLLVCKNWLIAGHDNILWKKLFIQHFQPRTSVIRDKNTSWKSEYQRLCVKVPVQHCQTLSKHTDEVLHVKFSHDGQQLVSCSKDNHFIVWIQDKKSEQFQPHFVQDMQIYQWKHTWASQFNRNDSLLMVSGVVSDVNGEIAIFKTGRRDRSNLEESEYAFSFLCRIINDPYDMLGCFCTDEYFMSSTLQYSEDGVVTTVWLCKASESTGDDDDQLINLDNSIKALFKFKNSILLFARFLQVYKRKGLPESGHLWTACGRPLPDPVQDDDMEVNVNLPGGDPSPNLSEEAHEIIDDEQCLVFICSDKTTVPHQIGFQRISKGSLEAAASPTLWTAPEKVIEMYGHIVGVALSPDHQQLYVNVRSWPENCVPDMNEPPCISTQIELKTICLATLSLLPITYRGHQGFTASDSAFYLYLDISASLIGSGSEDKFGYIWDRYYGCLVGKLAHEQCVNSVAFHPQTEDVCATASDDYTIKIWRTPSPSHTCD